MEAEQPLSHPVWFPSVTFPVTYETKQVFNSAPRNLNRRVSKESIILLNGGLSLRLKVHPNPTLSLGGDVFEPSKIIQVHVMF